MIIKKNQINSAIKNLTEGNIIIYPTDTLYGFGVDSTNSKAIESLNILKNRNDPLSIILSSSEQIKNYGKLNDESEKLINRIFPGPFTILIDSIESNLSSLVNESSDYIGIRIPNHPFSIKIVETLGNPIITTSVNKKNQPSFLSLPFLLPPMQNLPVFLGGRQVRALPAPAGPPKN